MHSPSQDHILSHPPRLFLFLLSSTSSMSNDINPHVSMSKTCPLVHNTYSQRMFKKEKPVELACRHLFFPYSRQAWGSRVHFKRMQRAACSSSFQHYPGRYFTRNKIGERRVIVQAHWSPHFYFVCVCLIMHCDANGRSNTGEEMEKLGKNTDEPQHRYTIANIPRSLRTPRNVLPKPRKTLKKAKQRSDFSFSFLSRFSASIT